jgi:hypothetical protein
VGDRPGHLERVIIPRVNAHLEPDAADLDVDLDPPSHGRRERR